MSSIATRVKAERTNRWLLIGALAFAIVTGVLVFAALSSFGGDSGKSTESAVGQSVVVAKQNITANQKITADMVEVAKVSGTTLDNPASNTAAVIGKVARSEIVQGQPISLSVLALTDNTKDCGLACILPKDKPGIALQGNEVALVAGFVQPGDRVNVIGVFHEKRGDQDITRVETILQNVEVMAVAQASVEPVASSDASGTPVADTGSSVGVTSARPEDVKPNPHAGTVTLALTPDDGQLLIAARSRGEITLTLQPLGEQPGAPPAPTYYDQFGPLAQLPRR